MIPAPVRTLVLLSSLFLPISHGLAQGSWSTTPVPMTPNWTSAQLNDVTGISAQDAWAVGSFTQPTPPWGSETHTLAMHWDGNAWTHVPTVSPSPYPGGANNFLHGVDAISSSDVWAGGERHGDAGGLSTGAWIHVQHFDGSSWTEVTVPPPPGGVGVNFSGTRVLEVLALASNDVWFGGQWASVTPQFTVAWHPLAMHWDGSNLTLHPTPVVYDSGNGFRSVSMSALAPNDIWAACSRNSASGASLLNVILHWDGNSWSQIPVPNGSVSHSLRTIEALASNDIWAFGEISFSTAPYILHFDGATWTEISTGPSTRSSHAAGPHDIYSAKASVSHYDGTSWSTVATFPQFSNPLIFALDADGAGGLWAVGRHTTNNVLPLAAHMDSTVSASSTPRVGCVSTAPPQSLIAATMPVLGQTLILHAGDPTDVATLVPTSTQSFVVYSLLPNPIGSCGPVLLGFGPGSSQGELMIDVSPTSLILLDGPIPWAGPTSPAVHILAIPDIPALAGITIYSQGVLFDPIGPSAPGVLTETLNLRLGY